MAAVTVTAALIMMLLVYIIELSLHPSRAVGRSFCEWQFTEKLIFLLPRGSPRGNWSWVFIWGETGVAEPTVKSWLKMTAQCVVYEKDKPMKTALDLTQGNMQSGASLPDWNGNHITESFWFENESPAPWQLASREEFQRRHLLVSLEGPSQGFGFPVLESLCLKGTIGGSPLVHRVPQC